MLFQGATLNRVLYPGRCHRAELIQWEADSNSGSHSFHSGAWLASKANLSLTEFHRYIIATTA